MPNFRDPFGYRALAGQIAAFRTSMERHMTATSDKLDTIDTALAKLGTDMTKTLADLSAQVAAGGTADPATLARLDTIATTLTGFDSQAVAADPSIVAPPSAAPAAPAA